MVKDGMKTKQVLIVEDNITLAKILVRYLIRQGLQATTTETVAGAMQLLSDHRFDALVVDIQLRDQCGLDLAWLLNDSSIPVVMMTADDTQIYREQACEAGASALLEKPFSLTLFSRVLNCLITGHRCLPKCTIEPLLRARLQLH